MASTQAVKLMCFDLTLQAELACARLIICCVVERVVEWVIRWFPAEVGKPSIPTARNDMEVGV